MTRVSMTADGRPGAGAASVRPSGGSSRGRFAPVVPFFAITPKIIRRTEPGNPPAASRPAGTGNLAAGDRDRLAGDRNLLRGDREGEPSRGDARPVRIDSPSAA